MFSRTGDVPRYLYWSIAHAEGDMMRFMEYVQQAGRRWEWSNEMTHQQGRRERVRLNKTGFEPADDAAVAAAMAEQNDGAWWEFDRRYAGKLMSFVAGRFPTLDDGEQEDIFQNVLDRIARGLPTYRPQPHATFASWCFAVADSECLDELRRRAQEPQLSQLVSFEEIEQRYDSSVRGAPERLLVDEDTGDVRMPTEEEAIFQEAMASLSPVDQTVLHMSLYAKDPDQQIAEVVQKPASQIRMIRHKAKEKLKRACLRLSARRHAS
jgi:RNA polymerase sigma factor (sigma-70 family)